MSFHVLFIDSLWRKSISSTLQVPKLSLNEDKALAQYHPGGKRKSQI